MVRWVALMLTWDAPLSHLPSTTEKGDVPTESTGLPLSDTDPALILALVESRWVPLKYSKYAFT